MALILKKAGSYRKAQGVVFRFAVESNSTDKKAAEAELKEYKDIQGSYYREDSDTKQPLFFSSTVLSEGTQLSKRRDNSGFYPLTDLEDEALQINEVAVNMQGKLEGLRRFSGMSKAGFLETAMRSVVG